MPGTTVWSDPIRLDYVQDHRAFLRGQKLAVSYHVDGLSGPMTWHAKALTTSYVTAPGAGSKGALEDEAAFPFNVTSWFFIDALDMKMPDDATAIVAFGDFHYRRRWGNIERGRRVARCPVTAPSQALRRPVFRGQRGHCWQSDRGTP
jgi:hypothetical protein